MTHIKFPKKKSLKDIEIFFNKVGLGDLVTISNLQNTPNSFLKASEPFKPDLFDLFSLYQFVLLNKRTTILEFGSGWSSLVFIAALSNLKKLYCAQGKSLERANLFEIFIVENEKKYLEITKKNIKKFKKKNRIENIKVTYFLSKVKMVNYNGNFASEYINLPLCNPDFIYLDGPGQFNIYDKINNFTISHNDMMPMSCDILKFEYFLIPGTIIIVDGRGANSNYLKKEFKRNWFYKYDKKIDQHVFFLKDKSLGRKNNKLLNFYKS